MILKLAASTLGVVLGGLLIVLLDIPTLTLVVPAAFVLGGTLLRRRTQP